MATRKQTAARRKNIKKAQKARRKSPRKRARAAAAANPRRKRRKAAAANPRRKKTRRAAAAANPRRKRRKAAAASANPRRKRRKAAAAAANPRRKRRRSQANDNSWRGQPIRHRKAAKKGIRRKKAKAARRRSHRDNPAMPATNINVTASAPAARGNPWPGQPIRHSRAAKKGWARRKRGKAGARRGGKKRCPPCRAKRDAMGHFTGRVGRRDNPMLPSLPESRDNPYTPALYENPFDTKSVVSYGAAAVTVALGLIAADLVDRAMATRKPAKTAAGTEAKRAWYGRDAAAAQRMRPDAWRLGAQAAGAVISLALAYFSRNIKVVPWLLGGFGLGFGANLLKKLSDWWLMPAILKVKEGEEGKETLANRLFPMEQASIQNEVTKMFQNWDAVDSLKGQQQETALIQSPLGNTTTGPAYQLGKAQGDGASASSVGAPNQRQFLNTGRLGNCPACGGHDGCYSDCGTLCPNCEEYNPRTSCECTVEEGDDLAAIAAAGGVDISQVDIMNGGTPATYWRIGNRVKLPYGACCALDRQQAQPGTPVREPVREPVSVTEPTPVREPAAGPFMAPIPTAIREAIPAAALVAGPPSPFNLGGVESETEDE